MVVEDEDVVDVVDVVVLVEVTAGGAVVVVDPEVDEVLVEVDEV